MEKPWNKVSQFLHTNFSFFAINSRCLGSVGGSFGAHLIKFSLFNIIDYKNPTSWCVVCKIQENKLSTIHVLLKTPISIGSPLFGSFENILIKYYITWGMIFRMAKNVRFVVLISIHYGGISKCPMCCVVTLIWFSWEQLTHFIFLNKKIENLHNLHILLLAPWQHVLII